MPAGRSRDPAEPVRVRVAAGQADAVRVAGIWLSPGGQQETVAYEDAREQLESGVLEDQLGNSGPVNVVAQ